ncbi:MAG TPA: cation:proton antiporter [Acidimicrobiia bacterium]|nr:cation:proton antiporter [Acidimicrobiia bacterium]
MLLAAAGPEAAKAFVEIGAVALVLAALARVAGRLGVTTIPFYLLAGLAVGEGGIAPLDVSADFIELVAEIGVLLLLLTLGLEYTADELRYGLRTGLVPGLTDAVLNFTPGLAAGLLLGWDVTAAVLLGGVCWVSSSGIVAKVLSDLDRLANRETPSVLNLLVIEDLAMAVYLPVAAALVAGKGLGETVTTVAVAVGAVVVILIAALRFGRHLSALLEGGSDEALLLAVFGLTLLIGGLAQEFEVSAAIGAFLVGLALSGPVQHRAGNLVGPLRDLFAAVFFLFFSFQIKPGDLVGALLPAAGLAIVAGGGKLLTGWVAAARAGVARAGRLRAGSALIARGEFSIVIASLGADLSDGANLGALAAAFVLVTAITGPLAARVLDSPRSGALTTRPTAPDT